MNLLKTVMNACIELLSINFNVFGFTINLWVVLLASAVITIIARLLWGLFE